MAFAGYLIKCGSMSEEMTDGSDIKLLHSFIIAQSYHVSKKIFDLGSFRDADGILKRTVLDHVSWTISFNIRAVTNTELQKFMNLIRSNYTSPKERKLSLKFYNPENDSYVTTDVYLPDPDFTIDKIIGTEEIKFKETQIKFIGY